jgi:hypothetical protein
MPFEIDHTPLDAIENSGAVMFGNETIVTRSLSEVIADVKMEKRRKQARFNNPEYVRKLNETVAFLKAVKSGEVSQHYLTEVLSTSDFPILFGDILDLRLLGYYNQTTPTWSMYAQRGSVQDFRPTRIIALDGLQTPLYPANAKPELSTVQYDDDLAETDYSTQVQVYERGVAYNWRMLMDRRGAFLNDIPKLLGRAALRTEEKFATTLFVSATGPNVTFFSVANANLITGNPALGIPGLKAGLNTMYAQVDSQGDPIFIEGVTLVVPPLLKTDAIELLKANQLELVPGTSGTRVFTPPWVGDFRMAVNWYLPHVDVSANKNTGWYLFADPNTNRPAMEVTFLAGYERPTLWQKAPNTMRVGGSVDPMMGDFQDGSIHQKIMHIIGGTLLDPKVAAASNGSGIA